MSLNARSQHALAVAGVVSLVLVLGGFVAAHYIPPPKANWTPEHLQSFYESHTDLKRFGIFLLLFATALYAALPAGMTLVLERVEGGRPLAIMQAVIGACGAMLLILFAMLLALAAFRPGRDPETTQMLHDAGFFMAFLSAGPFSLQAATQAFAVLGDRSPQPLLPRWFGYLLVSIAVLLLPGIALLFFKTGPLSYHGIIGYWIPLVVFAAWMLAQAWAIRLSAQTPLPAAA